MQIFPPWSNAIARTGLVGIVLFLPLLAAVAIAVVRSDFYTGEHMAPEQPVQFSHRHHIQEVGLDCRYCHTGVETGEFAGIPTTYTCMTCHSQIWNESPMLEPVRQSIINDQPLRWQRVNNLPDHVYFDHSIHINKGVACTVCHGDVSQMALTYAEHPLHMRWCLDCHRRPEDFIRPRETIFESDWRPEEAQREVGLRLVEEYGISRGHLDDCTVCHR
ncbi:MAG: cytochrome c3 family protein [Pseudohongiellaceae bacterium]